MAVNFFIKNFSVGELPYQKNSMRENFLAERKACEPTDKNNAIYRGDRPETGEVLLFPLK